MDALSSASNIALLFRCAWTPGGLFNHRKHADEVVVYLLVADAENPQAPAPEDRISFAVIIHPFRMDRSVNFDHQLCRMAIEVNDESGDDLLTAEMPA